MFFSNMRHVFKYDLFGEYAGLGLSVLLLIFMIVSKPKKTKAFIFLYSGAILSVAATIVQIAIARIAGNVEELYDRNVFTALIAIFLTLYAIILIDIFNYIVLLSEKKIKKRTVTAAIYIVITMVYIIGAVRSILLKLFFYVRSDGVDITHFTRFYCTAGILCALVCMVIVFFRRSDISRVIKRGVFITAPIVIIVLILQMQSRHMIFSAITYVVPLFSFYLLFHSNPYDEITGSQNINAMESRFLRNLKSKKTFYLAYFDFPQIIDSSSTHDYNAISVMLADLCRAIERLSKRIYLYRVNYGTFLAIFEVKERSDAENYAELIRDILDKFCDNTVEQLHYFLGVCGDSKRFGTFGNKWTQSFMHYLRIKYSKDGENVYYFAKGADFREFDETYKIEQALNDIRATMNPDDERILCYAQPIYSVDNNSFRSAEALMRLEIDGKMIPPDQFIKIAEKEGCIHALTVIMMHKVCKAVEELARDYDFDAVTINCSTMDFVDKHFHREIMDIIHSYKIDQKMIRLELTETMMAENYDAVRHNMDRLNREGIQLYMDDFGTGYSNLERVLDVPVQTIKFDKSLLYKSIEDKRVDDIITFMIDMFKKNGFITLVEGVEDETQKKYSLERGFDYIQGYHYAKPAPIDNLKKYFVKKS